MATEIPQGRSGSVWQLARRQHGVVSAAQLAELGLSESAIRHRVRKGRLHRLWRGVYAVGRPDVGLRGWLMAAVLACGPGAVLSHWSAALLLGLIERATVLSVSVPRDRDVRRQGVRVHRVDLPASDRRVFDRIPVTSPTRTLIDLATVLNEEDLTRAVNQADKLRRVTPEEVRADLATRQPRPGVVKLRALLSPSTFVRTDSVLEQRFLRLALEAGLPLPETGVRLNGYRVDFLWRDLRLVVETDGFTYHRTELSQARDRRRDTAHAAAGYTTLRFSNVQVNQDPDSVVRALRATARRLAA